MTTLLGRLFNSRTHRKQFQSKDFQNGFAKGDLPFGLSLMSELGEGNVVVSPAGLRATLRMLYEGAKGQTAEQIAQIGLIPESVNARWVDFKRLAGLLNTPAGRGSLGLANRIWVNQSKTVNDIYEDTLRKNYGVEAHSADFSRNLESERTEINRWVLVQTNEKTDEIVPANSICTETGIVLANALYFKTSWVHKFESNLTKQQNFTLSGGETVQVDLMRHRFPEFRYGELNGNQMAMLPYENHDLAMLVALPPRGQGVKEL